MPIRRSNQTVSRAPSSSRRAGAPALPSAPPRWFQPAKARRPAAADIPVPPVHDWRTTDQDEINKRRLRARTEPLHVSNTDAAQPIFSNFRVKSASGMTYAVEIRDVAHRQVAARKLKMARALGTEDLLEETRDALLAALHAAGRALAVEQHLPEPSEPNDALLPPLSLHWTESLTLLRGFLANPAHDWKPVAETLTKVLEPA